MPICEIKFEPYFYILAQAKITLSHVQAGSFEFCSGSLRSDLIYQI